MTKLIIEYLNTAADLDASSMSAVRGGLNAVINNSQAANQVVTGGAGPVFAMNNPISAPSNVLTENNPVTMLNLNTVNLANAAQNVVGGGFDWVALDGVQ